MWIDSELNFEATSLPLQRRHIVQQPFCALLLDLLANILMCVLARLQGHKRGAMLVTNIRQHICHRTCKGFVVAATFRGAKGNNSFLVKTSANHVSPHAICHFNFPTLLPSSGTEKHLSWPTETCTSRRRRGQQPKEPRFEHV